MTRVLHFVMHHHAKKVHFLARNSCHLLAFGVSSSRFCCMLKLRQELEKIRRRLESELADVREQLGEKTSQLEELQAQMNRREEELQKTLNR